MFPRMSSAVIPLYNRAIGHLQKYPDRPQPGLKHLHKAATLGTNPSYLSSIEKLADQQVEVAWSARALCSLGNFYLEGRYGLPKDIVQGCKLLEDARRIGSKAAAVQLALLGMTRPQQSIDYNIQEGLSTARDVARSHVDLAPTVPVTEYYNYIAASDLASNISNISNTANTLHNSFSDPLQISARNGIVGAQLRLGLSYLPQELALHVSRSTVSGATRIDNTTWNAASKAAEGVGWICRAASCGFARALFACGKLLLCLPIQQVHLVIIDDDQHQSDATSCKGGASKVSGGGGGSSLSTGPPEEKEQRASRRGYFYIEQAAENNDNEAQVQLGLWHEESIDIEYIDAFGYLIRNEIERATHSGGTAGRPRTIQRRRFDDAKAVQWYVRASGSTHAATQHTTTNQAHPAALVRLGRLVEQGRGVKSSDRTLAAELYMRAAHLGSSRAMYNLGRLHVDCCSRRTLSKDPKATAGHNRTKQQQQPSSPASSPSSSFSSSSSFSPSLQEGLEWFQRASRQCPAAAFCAGVVLSRLADATVKQSYAGPPTQSSSGQGYALQASIMFSTCVKKCHALHRSKSSASTSTTSTTSTTHIHDRWLDTGQVQMQTLSRASQYHLSMLLLRWNIADAVKGTMDDGTDVGNDNGPGTETDTSSSTSRRRLHISKAVHWLKALACGDKKIQHSASNDDNDDNDDTDDTDDTDDNVGGGTGENSGRNSFKKDVVVGLAAHAVATLYMNGIVAPQSIHDMVEGLQGSAIRGRAILQPDMAIAIDWFRRAAVAGNGNAAFNLASMIEEGKGTRMDKDIARAWYECSARHLLANTDETCHKTERHPHRPLGNKNKKSATTKNHLYRNRHTKENKPNKKQNRKEGWLSSFDSEREYNLGILYMTGRGTGCPPDRNSAIRWLKKAAKHRHCDAMHTLAWLLIQQDEHKEALRVLYNAAKEGHEESSEAVATMYQRGIGVVPNRKKSASWFEIGSEQRQTGLKAETMLWRLGHPSFYPSALV